jgi:hypothetical protein
MVDSLEFATWEVTFDRVVIRFSGKEDDDVGLQHFEFCPKRGMPSHDVAEFSHGGRLRWSQQSKLLQRKPNREMLRALKLECTLPEWRFFIAFS